MTRTPGVVFAQILSHVKEDQILISTREYTSLKYLIVLGIYLQRWTVTMKKYIYSHQIQKV